MAPGKAFSRVANAAFGALSPVMLAAAVVSLPLGTYVFFFGGFGGEDGHSYPAQYLGAFAAGIGFGIPVPFTIGQVFAAVTVVFSILVAVSIMGPGRSYFGALRGLFAGSKGAEENYMLEATRWFGIMVVASIIINAVQESFGISITPPPVENDLMYFLSVATAPIAEEIGFRVMLIGVPLYLAYSRRTSLLHIARCLWHPSRHLHAGSARKPMALIIAVAVFFGIAHIISGQSWSDGKATQAAFAGVILGWVYYRYGLVAAVMIHFMANYVIFAATYFVAVYFETGVKDAFEHEALSAVELAFVLSGAAALAATAAGRLVRAKSL